MNVIISDLTPANMLERVKNVHDGAADSDKATRDRLNNMEPSPRSPMTPQQLDTYRPQKNAVGTHDEAKAIAYKIGIKELEPLIRRIIALEEKVAALRSAPLV